MNLELYTAARDQIKTGDLLLWRSRNIIGAAIRMFSRASVNHACLVDRLGGYSGFRLFAIDAGADGMQPKYLSLQLQNYSGEVWWYPLKDEWESARPLIEQRMWEQVGIKYDYPSLFMNAIRHVEADGDLLFCSEGAFLQLGYKGTAPTPGEMPGLGIFKKEVRIA